MHWIWRNTIISTVIGLCVFLFLVNSETGKIPGLEAMALPLALALALFNLSGAGIYLLGRRYNAFLPWTRNIAARFFLEVSSGLLLAGLASLLFGMVFLTGRDASGDEGAFWSEYWDGAIKLGVIMLVITYVYALVNFSIYSYNQYTLHQIDRLTEERNKLNLQFEALRSQLSPHFLFNALNTISSLIYRDAAIAEDFIRRMAHTFRYILKTNEQQLITLAEEMEMLRSYLFMQQVKYEQCIELSEQVDDAVLDTMVPPLALQMLVENAIKHNRICEEEKLVVKVISGQDGYIVVRNNIIPKSELIKIGNNLVDRPGSGTSHRIGLSNIRNRYAFFSRKKIEILKDKDFTVKLPLIHTIEN